LGTAFTVPQFDATTNPDKLTFTHNTTSDGGSTSAQFAMMRDDFSLENDGDYVQLSVNIANLVGGTTTNLAGLVLNHVTDSPADRTNDYTMNIVANGRIDVVRYTTTSIQFPDTLTYLLTRTCDPVT
jgi:hypothetical protein